MDDKKKIIFLCLEEELTRERKGYHSAFLDLGLEVVCSGETYLSSSLVDARTILILQPEASPILPYDVFTLNIPVACFQIDTNDATARRIEASRLFDLTFVFHPHFEEQFKRAGVKNTFLLPHAIERDLFQTQPQERVFQIGWVGRTDGDNYSQRREILPLLKERFRMNDPFKTYTQEELILLYQQSQIVVNIGKDDYLKDANIRCFEAMASGALLFTSQPSELSDLGFEEGKHFIGFNDKNQLMEKLEWFFQNSYEITKIAEVAKALVLSKHTYHQRAANILEQANKKPKGTARYWNHDRQMNAMMNYFTFRRCFAKAHYSFKQIDSFTLIKIKSIFPLLKLFLSKKINREQL